MDNSDWAAKLKACYKRETKEDRNIRLPSPELIRISGEQDTVVIEMTSIGVSTIVQDDKAAFEGWALALRRWCLVEKIVLKWNLPLKTGSDLHYQRFLYRAKRFLELFPDWFQLPEVERERLRSARALGPGPLILNVPGSRHSPVSTNASAAEREQSEAERDTLIDGRPEPSEAELERELHASAAFKKHFSLDKVDRQRPVGLFKDKVTKDQRIFNGGSSAIDLIGLGHGTIYLFELKKPGNIKVGAISELLFYTSVIRDAAGSGAPFQFREARPS